MKESGIRKALKARVEEWSGEVRAVSWLGRSHAPDVLVLLPFTIDRKYVAGAGMIFVPRYNHGSHVFVETKRPGKDATEAQAREHVRLRDAGCAVEVIATTDELDAWLPPL